MQEFNETQKPDYSSLVERYRQTQSDLEAGLKEPRPDQEDEGAKEAYRNRQRAIIRAKLEARSSLFADTTQRIASIAEERLGNFRQTGQEFSLLLKPADIKPYVDPLVFEEFTNQTFDALGAVSSYFEDNGFTEDMSGPTPSHMEIIYEPDDDNPTYHHIYGRKYKKGKLLS